MSEGFGFDKRWPEIRAICTAAGFPFDGRDKLHDCLGKIEKTLIHLRNRIEEAESALAAESVNWSFKTDPES